MAIIITNTTPTLPVTNIAVRNGAALAAEAAAKTTIEAAKGNLEFGSSGDDTVKGTDGNDTMFGGAGLDVLDGGAGNDILNGGIGDDILIGGLGNDVLDGGDDDDVIWGDVQGSDETVAELMSKSDEQLRILSDAAEAATRAAAEALKLKNASLDVATLLSNTKDRILGGSGDDLIFGGMGSDVISGGTGNDRIFAGAGDDVASGGTGNDSIYGEAGNDRISGDDGNDLLRGGDGNDTVWGGEGADTIGGDAGHDLVSAGNGNDTVQGGEGNDSLYGDAGDDSLDGNAGNDLLVGGLGNDVLRGGDGNDNLAGDAGNDSLYGDAGDDRLWGGAGDDLLDGGTGADMLSGDAGNDSLLGGAGNDWLDGGDGNDTMDGGADHDTLRGGNNNDSMSGGDGNDSMSGDAGNDVMLGGAGNDTIDGGAGKDELDAGFGDDLAIFVATQGMNDAGSGVFPTVAPAFDVYKGGEEPARSTEVDTLRVYITGDQAAANSHLFGYANGNINNLTDPVIVYDNNGQKILEATEFERLQIFVDNIGVGGGGGSGGTVNLFTAGADYVDFDNVNFSAFAGQSSPNFYNALGGNDIVLMSSSLTTVPASYDPTRLLDAGAGDDRVFGRDRADKIDGGAGQDAIWGGQSNDEIDGGDGNDTLFGGAGDDIVKGGNGNDVIMTDTGHDANEVIIGGAGTDRLSVDSALAGVTVNAFAGGGKTLVSGIEVFTFGAGNDRLDLRTGGTYDVGSTISMGAGNDAVLGSAQRESIFGGLGNDDLQGGGGDDTISGEADNDRMLGEAGNDIMNGGTGNDTMSGGDNNDTLLADTGDDVANGEAGDDIVFGGTGRDFIGGGEGDDDLFGDNDGDAVGGDSGADFVSGGDGNDLLFGESVYGTPTAAAAAVSAWQGLTLEQRLAFAEGESNVLANSDTLMGETGDDTIVGHGGDDMLAGGSGNDWLFGGAGADVAYGDAGKDSVYGGTGNDTLGGGDDVDVIDGGKGDDVLVYNQDGLWNQFFASGGLSAYVATSGSAADFGILQAVGLAGSAAGGALGQSYGRTTDQFFGGDGLDKLLGTTGNDVISFLEIRQTGTTSTETVRARSIETFDMGAGDDIVDLSGAVPVRDSLGGSESKTYDDDLDANVLVLDMGTGNDIAFGSEADESMIGGAGHDRLSGSEGEDTLVGGDGAGADTFWEVTFGNKTYAVSDVLSGGDDDDMLVGDLGIDFLHGGKDDDSFVYNALNEGGDYIADFNRGDDTLVISRAGFGLTAGVEIGSGVSLVMSGGAIGTGPTFIYNAGNGELSFDIDGSGAGSTTVVTTLINLPMTLSASDFDLV